MSRAERRAYIECTWSEQNRWEQNRESSLFTWNLTAVPESYSSSLLSCRSNQPFLRSCSFGECLCVLGVLIVTTRL